MHLILKIVGITVPEEKNDSDSGGEKKIVVKNVQFCEQVFDEFISYL